MKQVLLFFALCTGMVCKAQNLFFYLDNTSTQPLKQFSGSEVKNSYYTWQWIGLQFKNGTGLFLQASEEPTTSSAVAGFFISKSYGVNSAYGEIGLAFGKEWNKEDRNAFVTTGYIWFETKPNDSRAKGKLLLQCSPYYTTVTGLWIQGFLLISPTKWLSIGAMCQTGGIVGPRVQLNLPKGFSIWFAKDLGKKNIGSGGLCTIGVQFVHTFSLKKEKR